MGHRLRTPGVVGVMVSASLAAGVALGACGGGRSSATAPSAGPTAAPTSPFASGTTITPPTSPPSAAADLAAYFSAAADLDRRLKVAAAAANGAIGAGAISISRSTLDAIAAADPSPAARRIPAGLAPDVLLPVLKVQNDLVSRFYAFRGFVVPAAATVPGTIPRTAPEPGSLSDADYLLRCLGSGAPAAASFPADLAAARAAAGHSPPVAAVDPSSRAAAELAIRLQVILGVNSGCMSCGGGRITGLEPITWHHVAPLTPEGRSWEGHFGGLLFTAQYSAGHGWTVTLNAC